MLVELRVRDLGVIEDSSITLGSGMTALTGETGAGKTLVVEALELLMGGRADPVIVRSGAKEALVEGRFFESIESEESESILARSVPNSGRSRAWLDGGMATASALSEAGSRLVDLHGQHSHQSLLDPASQRAALDRVRRSGPRAASRCPQPGPQARLGDRTARGRPRRVRAAKRTCCASRWTRSHLRQSPDRQRTISSVT